MLLESRQVLNPMAGVELANPAAWPWQPSGAVLEGERPGEREWNRRSTNCQACRGRSQT